ncbi:hypothetical protein ACFE04_031503 [Oxalis oulophora]
MSTTGSSQSTPIKSKIDSIKQIDSTPKRTLNPLAAPTPEKQQSTPPITRRARHRGVALSIKEVRQVASGSQQTDQSKSARKQILTWPAADEESLVAEDIQICPKPAPVGPPKLPQIYEMLGEFFDSLDCSIRLMKMKGSTVTFTKVSPKIESLTDRRFTHKHLAQLKFILPEAIEIKKMLVFDERTCCMKADLLIALNVEAVEIKGKEKPDNKNLFLRKVFRKRLLKFHKAHPQGDEVPEEPLPEPFNQSHKSVHLHVNVTDRQFPNVEQPTLSNQTPAVASILPRSFQRRFSQTVRNNVPEKTDQIPSPTNLSPISTSSGKLTCVSLSHLPNRLPETPIKGKDAFTSKIDGSPLKFDLIQSTPSKVDLVHSTPSKNDLGTPARLMTETPVSKPPKRCYMSPDEASSKTNKLARRPPRNRSLQFDDTPVKNEKFKNEVIEVESALAVDNDDDVDNNDYDDDDDDILPQDLLQSIREKELKALEERDPAISQAKRRQQLIACLPKLFNTIRFFFQSLKRSFITKEELMYKIVVNQCDMVDKREVEEQLSLLLELVPEWISEKSALSGDLLISVNKTSSAESIRAQLAEAK